jgi:ribA/ribD-fused uncharacterized protein
MKDIEIRDGYALFWGGWASNWYMSNMSIDGVDYNCVEQYMMAGKAKLFWDYAILGKIMKSNSPKEQKKMGRGVIGFKMDEWDKVKFDVVKRGNLEKYKQNPYLMKKLIDIGDVKFVECSPYDKIWGIGMDMNSEDATNPAKWNGLNLLGKVLDEVRKELIK